MLKLPPLSLYIHFPWCVEKCPYCDFNSHKLKGDMPSDLYLNSLIKDLQTHHKDRQGRIFQSIFLGGGTPSLFPMNALEELFAYLNDQQLIDDSAEITLEANPGTIERGAFKDYKSIGINRISLGVQSFQDEKLKKLGRIHSAKEVYLSVDEIKKSSIGNFNIDLMHGLPSQSQDDALYDLNQAISLEPTHLSWYQLTVEPNTAFEKNPPILPYEDELAKIEISGKALLEAYGFKQYEISAYAKNDLFSAHNLNYWQFGDYIGIGAGAHSKITELKNNKIKRYWKIKHPKFYMNSDQFIHGEAIISNDLIYEFALNALRLTDGFTLDLFEHRTGLERSLLKDSINQAVSLGLLTDTKIKLIPTEKGKTYLNNLINLFA